MSNTIYKKSKKHIGPLDMPQSLMTLIHDRILENARIISEINNNSKLRWACYDCGTNSDNLDKKATHECLECIPQLKRLCKECNLHHHRNGKSTKHVSRLLY